MFERVIKLKNNIVNRKKKPTLMKYCLLFTNYINKFYLFNEMLISCTCAHFLHIHII